MTNKYLTNTLLIAGVLMGAAVAINALFPLVVPFVVYIVILGLAGLSFLFGKWIEKSITERPALYVNRFMISMLVMMMSFLIFFGLYVYFKGEHRFEVAIISFISYIVLKINMIVFLKKSEKIKAINSGK